MVWTRERSRREVTLISRSYGLVRASHGKASMANTNTSPKTTRRRTRVVGPSIHPGVEIRLAPRVYPDASGAPAVLAYRGFAFALDMLGEVKLRLIGGDGTTGTRVQSKIARDLCLHAYLTLLDAAVDDDWRERNIHLYDDAAPDAGSVAL